MKHQLSLSEKLTLSTSFVMIPVIVFLAISVIGVFRPRVVAENHRTTERVVLSNAKLIALRQFLDVSKYKLHQFEEIDLKAKFKDILDNQPLAVNVALFDKNQTLILQMNQKNYSNNSSLIKQAFSKINYTKRKNKSQKLLDIKHKADSLNLEYSIIIDQWAVSIVPFLVADNTYGYLVYIESISKSIDFQKALIKIIIATFAIGLFVILLGIAIIGKVTMQPIATIAKTAKRIANGDLANVSTITKGVAETIFLSKAITNMSMALSAQVNSIKKLIIDSTKISHALSSSMSNMTASATEQASAVSETVITVSQMKMANKNVIDNVKKIVKSVEKTTEASMRGQEAVEAISLLIMQIKKDSIKISSRSRMLLSSIEEIGHIMIAVSSISEQSKILSVNASIEAAKAGPYGAGFAVIAQEVKELARQSQKATEQITVTLTSIKKAIEGVVYTSNRGEKRAETVVSTIANVGVITNDISKAIFENSNIANIISNSVSHQKKGFLQIAIAIEQINIAALKNQTVAQDIEANTKHNSNSIAQLGDLVEGWSTEITVDNNR